MAWPGFEALAASAVALTALLAGLYWLLRQQVGRRRPIPALWLAVQLAPRRGGRRWPPPWFWICALALSLVAVGTSLPYASARTEPGRSTLLVLAHGLESQADENGRSRLELGRLEIQRRLASGGSSDRWALIAVGAAARVVAPWTAERSEIERGASGVRAEAAPVDWAAALELAEDVSGGRSADVVLVGSHSTAALRAWRDARPNRRTHVESVEPGSSQRNRGFCAVRAKRLGTDAQQVALEVGLRACGPGATAAWLDDCEIGVRSGGQPIPHQLERASVAASSSGPSSEDFSRNVRIELGAEVDEVTLRLATDETADALPADDELVVILRAPPRVLCWDSRADGLAGLHRRIADALPGAELAAAPAAPDANELLAADVLVAGVDADLDLGAAIPTLLYRPSTSSRPMLLVGYDEQSELTEGINLVAPPELDATPLPTVPGMSPVLLGRGAARAATLNAAPECLAAWGSPSGVRRVALGFDLALGDLGKHHALPTLVVHALDWLGPASARPGTIWAGEDYPVASGGAARATELTLPSGERVAIEAQMKVLPGAWLVERGVCWLAGARKGSERFAVNARCADLRVSAGEESRATGAAPGDERGDGFEPAATKSYWDAPFLWAGLCVLVAEALWHASRTHRWRTQAHAASRSTSRG